MNAENTIGRGLRKAGTAVAAGCGLAFMMGVLAGCPVQETPQREPAPRTAPQDPMAPDRQPGTPRDPGAPGTQPGTP